MSIDPKAVTVFLDASPSGKRRAAHAARLAQHWGAHLVGVHVVFAGVRMHPSMCYARGHDAIEQVIVDERESEATAEAASVLLGKHFRALCASLNVTGEFRPIRRGDAAEQAILRSFVSDLVVVGHPEPNGLPDDMAPERILLASGVPLLIVPNAWQGETIGNRILTGWNASPEARRAVSDATAFLPAAESVTVLVVNPRDGGRYGRRPGEDIARHLARHGAHVRVAQVTSEGAAIAQVILGYALESASDLLVVGAYSHARLREILLGGATRTLLARMPVPVFISR